MNYNTDTRMEILEMYLKYQEENKKMSKKFMYFDILFFVLMVSIMFIANIEINNRSVILVTIAVSTICNSHYSSMVRYNNAKHEIESIKNTIKFKKILEESKNKSEK